MGDVVAARSPVVLQSACQGERPGVAGGDAEAVARHLDRAGETGVQIEGAHVVDAHAGVRQGPPGAGGEGGGGVDVAALRQVPDLVGVGPAPDVGDLVGAEAPGPRRGGVGDDDGGAHVDVHHGVAVLRVWEVDHPVVGRDGGDLGAVAWCDEPRERVGHGHGVEALHQRPHDLGLGGRVMALGVGQRRLHQRVHGGGGLEAVRPLHRMDPHVGFQGGPRLGPPRR